MSKTITDLRAALFDTLQQVKDGRIDLDKARAINELGKTLIDSAKVEVDFLRVTDGNASEFLGADQERVKQINGSPAWRRDAPHAAGVSGMLTMLKATGAGYRQGVPKTERKRCDTCAHHRPGSKQHGLVCYLYGFTCKTHGVCDWWLVTPPQTQGGAQCDDR